jgi:hypothetical protein
MIVLVLVVPGFALLGLRLEKERTVDHDLVAGGEAGEDFDLAVKVAAAADAANL